MKQFITRALAALTLTTSAWAQPIPIYENFGEVTDSPQIDALAFANYGTFSVFSSLPYDFQNTRYFTNRGSMSGTIGFDFSTAFSDRPKEPATSFVNARGALITAGSFGGFFGLRPGFGGFGGTLSPSFLLVSADNITNEGFMVATASGLLRLTGRNVDLRRGGLAIGRLEESSTHFVTESNFFPDPAIYDVYWGGMVEQAMPVAPRFAITPMGTNVSSGPHVVTNTPFPFPSTVNIQMLDPLVAVVTNAPTPTNIIRQAVFVGLTDTNLAAEVRFSPSPDDLPYQTAIVEIRLADTNVVTGELEYSTLYLTDRLASSTNYAFLSNLAATPVTFRPANFELTRQPPFEFLFAAPGMSELTNTFFFDPADTNFAPVVTNWYSAYSARVETLASSPPNVPLLEVTELPGRIEINAANLDMRRARLRGAGLISINTLNLVDSTNVLNANVDGENVSFNLASPSGALNVQSLAKERVVRLNGPIRAWSAVWTNFFGITETNSVEEPPGSGEFTNVVTNIVTEIGYHMLVVDARQLQATRPVTTHDFITRADSIVLNDSLTVVRSLIIDAEEFTLNSRLTLTERLQNFGATNAPRVQSFINKGILQVPNIANFGVDRPAYREFFNRGILTANGILIRSDAFENSGSMRAFADGIWIETGTGEFLGSTTISATDLRLTATDLRFNEATNRATGTLFLNVARSLADTGEGANNLFTVTNGFQMLVKPQFGDLLGTRFESFAPRFARVEHVWAADDRGATAAGFENNVAIGTLVLGGDRETTHAFRGTGAQNALYVDFLEFTGTIQAGIDAGNIEDVLEINPNMTIYFADSNISPAELDGQLGGRLQWVRDFAGPANFIVVTTRDGTRELVMDRALRESMTIDSDNDGVPNGLDPYPIDPDLITLRGVRGTDDGVRLSWEAIPEVVYLIEYSSDLEKPVWKTLMSYSNSAQMIKTATVTDTAAVGQAERYYRVRIK
jgi:hypothetical protein